MQVIDGQASRELGMFDMASLLQSVPQVTGLQIDSAFTGFVLENGQGAAQVNLRGLGVQRVLMLINSRRLAPSGGGGAPTSADISTIPNIMVDRIEYLLDGASTIYGSDAVAGVVNVIMRKDFEGFEFQGGAADPNATGGGEKTLALAWGKTGGHWSLGIGAEMYERHRVRLRDRAYTEQCNRYLYEDENGNLLGMRRGLAPGTSDSPCRLRDVNRVFIPIGYGNVWYTPGRTNIDIPNYSEISLPVSFVRFNQDAIVPVDTDGDGEPDIGLVDPDHDCVADVDLQSDMYNYNGSERDRASDLLPSSRRINLYSYGEYDLGDLRNSQAYFDFLYANRKTEVITRGSTLFSPVPADNPFNPCNVSQPDGVNCLGFFGYYAPGAEVTPVVVVRGDRDGTAVDVDHLRTVAGIRGDLPGWQNGSGIGNWGYDLYFTHSASRGTELQSGVLERELRLSLETSVINPETGEITCGDGAHCVPVNMFADALYQPGGGNFATQAERDFLFGSRKINTKAYQSVFSGVIQGDVATLPWNDTSVPLALGFEYREDEIDSTPNEVGRDGLLISSYANGGAVGKHHLTELFMETEMELLNAVPRPRLAFNLAWRLTEESTYGTHSTYSAKTVYTPVDGVAFRGTYGTSFRAPNAHEQFLVGTTGFSLTHDPCVVPVAARAPSLDPNSIAIYDPLADVREQGTLKACRAHGVDPTTLGLDDINQSYWVEWLRKGGRQLQVGIDPETATSYTYGVVLDQPFWDTFTLRAEASYYDVRVDKTISQLGADYIVARCYSQNPGYASPLCRFITRDANGLIDMVESGFLNISAHTSRGIDYRVYFRREVGIFDRNVSVALDVRVTRLLENKYIFDGLENERAATPVAPEWEGVALLVAAYGDYRLSWRTNHIHGGASVPSDFFAGVPCRTMKVLCRPLGRTSRYSTHSASITWDPRDWSFALGIANVFDETPPLMDDEALGTQLNNIQLGAGYDLLGRRVFFSVTRQF